MKRSLITIALTIAGLLVAVGAADVIIFLNKSPGDEHKAIVFEVPNGVAFHHIANELQARGVITNAFKLGLYAKFTGQATHVKVGEYELFTDMKPADVLQTLVSGKSISYELVVPEGNNIFDIRDSLNKLWAGRGDDFLKLVTNQKFIQQLTGFSLPSLEGYLFPETYSLTKFTTNEVLVRHMFDKFQEVIKETNQNPKFTMPLGEQVILASMIEKETGAPEERPMIASVFYNRRAKHMRLQSDPTIIYGLAVERKGEVPKNITKADILHPTLYNTYTVPDLPTAPISNPGRAALKAALNPIESGYLFFVSRNDGTHVFTESLEKHTQAVVKFQVDKRAREGKSWRDLSKRNKSSSEDKSKN